MRYIHTVQNWTKRGHFGTIRYRFVQIGKGNDLGPNLGPFEAFSCSFNRTKYK